jgi:hypothetical protein
MRIVAAWHARLGVCEAKDYSMSAPQWSEEETDNPVYADTRGFFKVEQWTDDDLHIVRLIHAGNRIDRARSMFDTAISFDPARRYYTRQGIRVVAKWPTS